MCTHCARDVVDDGKKELKISYFVAKSLHIDDELLATFKTRGKFCSN